MDLVWEEPPPEALVSRPNGMYAQLAAALRENPNKWAIIPREYASVESAKGAALNLRNGRVKALPKGDYEVVANGTKIHIRYVGDASKESKAALRSVPDGPDPAKVRAWAVGQGVEVSKAGRLPQDLIRRYEEAQASE